MPRRRRAAHCGIDESYWDRLDNAAKIIPAITTSRSPNVFRITAVLSELVEPDVLQAATEKALSIMPSFALKLNRGLFWYYFDTNSEKPIVREEKGYPCAPIYKASEKGFLFRVLYYKKRISLEIYHALSDGMGAANFAKLIVYCYFNIKNGKDVPEEYIRREVEIITRDFDEDSFVRSFDDPSLNLKGTAKEKMPEAFLMNGYRFDGTRLGVLTALIPMDELRALAKSHRATMSEYLSALIIWSIFNTSYRRSNFQKPIVVSIPVNLRGMFDSATLRNFFGHMYVSVLPKRGEDFDSILQKTKAEFKKSLKREYFERQIADHVAIERIPGVGFVPIFIKNLIMRHSFKKAAKLYTVTFSNLGQVILPSMIEDNVERFELVIGASESHPKKVALCSFGNQLSLIFSSTIEDNSLERFMIGFLAEQGIGISVSSNETPEPKRK